MAEEEEKETVEKSTENTDTEQISNNDLLEMFDEVKGLIVTLTETVEKMAPVAEEVEEEPDDKLDSEEEEETDSDELESEADELLKNL